jgi:exopolysaccharide biosynthesis polyprenyl glycosylphosphotransferase
LQSRLRASADELDGRVSTDRRATTGSPYPPLARTTFLRRARRRGLDHPITEGGSDREIRLREAVYRRSLALADVLAAALALVVCVNLLGDDRLRPIALLALPLVVITGKAHRLYDRDELVVNKTTMDQAPALFQCATLYALLVVLLEDTFVDGTLSVVQVVGIWATLFASALLARRTARWFARATTPVERIMFVGVDESFERLKNKLPKGNRHARLVGRMSLDPLVGDPLREAGGQALHRMIEDLDVHRVVIEPSEALPEATLEFVREAKSIGVRVSLLPRILEVVGSTIEVDDVDGLTLLGVRRFGLSRSSKLIKRAFDAVGAAAGLLALTPLLLVIAAVIKLDSRGPVIYRQFRVGRGGRAFQMWKFRSMSEDADSLKGELLALVHPGAPAGLFKLRDDPRITRAGRWLRECSLDELPQLVNVLRGEMSLVGPRPLIADEDRQISGLDRARLQLTPGMTGHWQIQGARVPLAEMVKLDYLYVAGWSLWSDIKILLRTAVYVFARRGM